MQFTEPDIPLIPYPDYVWGNIHRKINSANGLITYRHGLQYVDKKKTKTYVGTDYGFPDIIIHTTEFRFLNVSNFELNSLFFSNYKNAQNSCILAKISPQDYIS